MNTMGEDDSPIIHAYDTIKGRRFLSQSAPRPGNVPRRPCHHLYVDRFGCPFNRTSEGNLDFRRFGGTCTIAQLLRSFYRAATSLRFG